MMTTSKEGSSRLPIALILFEDPLLTRKKFLTLQQLDYRDEIEVPGENIIFMNETITSIHINLLMKKVANEDYKGFNFDIRKYLSLQLNCLMDNDTMGRKICALITYFQKEHQTFPKGIVKLLNNWIVNDYPDRISKQDLKKLKDLYCLYYDYVKENADFNLKAEVDKVLNFLEDKILYSQGENKVNKPIAIYKQDRKVTLLLNNPCKVEPILPTSHSLYFDVLDWSEVEIARQLTLISSFLLSKVKVSELMFARWTKGEKYSLSPHIMKCIDRFNKISLWVTEEILAYDKSRFRAAAIEKFILIAKECFNLKNYNDCFNIVTALNSFSVKRLNKSWRKIVSFETMNTLMELNDLCSFSKNFSRLKAEVRKAQDCPYIPYLGVYLKDLAFLEEGPKYLKGELVNLEKIKKFGDIYYEIKSGCAHNYEFKPVFMLSFLADPQPDEEENLTTLSNRLEPKFMLPHIKHDKKRLTSTDKKSLDMTKTFHKIVIESMNDTLTNKLNLKDAIRNFISKK